MSTTCDMVRGSSDVRNPHGSTKVNWDPSESRLKVENANTHDLYPTIVLPGTPNHPDHPANSLNLTQKLCRTVKFGVRRQIAKEFCRNLWSSRFQTKYKLPETAPQRQDTFRCQW